jgi:hypothetical protein
VTHARIVQTGTGPRWLADGWRMFRAAPLGWIAMVFAYWLIMTFVSIVPLIGVAAASILVPAFSVGFMAAARAADRRAPVELALLFDGFRHHLRSQIVLGVIYFACLCLVLAATALADDGALAGWMLAGSRPDDEAMRSDAFIGALACAGLLYTPVLMMFWFAPPLAARRLARDRAGQVAVLQLLRLPDELARLSCLRSGHGAPCARAAARGALGGGARLAQSRRGIARISAPHRAAADAFCQLLRQLSRRIRRR